MPPLLPLHAAGAPTRIEQDAGGQAIAFDLQSIAVAGTHILEPLARAAPCVVRRCERGIAKLFAPIASAIVGIAPIAQEDAQFLETQLAARQIDEGAP